MACYTNHMQNREKFPYDVEMGTVMDFVDGKFMLIIKDEDWYDHEIKEIKDDFSIQFGYSNGIAFFIGEGGDVDNCDFYFNIQECDEKVNLLNKELLEVEVYFLDKENGIALKLDKTLSKDETKEIQKWLKQQAEIEFMPGEYDVNVEGMMSAYEPFELEKFEKCKWKM